MLQATKEPGAVPGGSSRHSKVASESAGASKLKVADVCFVVPDGLLLIPALGPKASSK